MDVIRRAPLVVALRLVVAGLRFSVVQGIVAALAPKGLSAFTRPVEMRESGTGRMVLRRAEQGFVRAIVFGIVRFDAVEAPAGIFDGGQFSVSAIFAEVVLFLGIVGFGSVVFLLEIRSRTAPPAGLIV